LDQTIINWLLAGFAGAAGSTDFYSAESASMSEQEPTADERVTRLN